MEKIRIAIGCDHGAFDLKQLLIEHLTAAGYEVEDFGTYTKESVHYPVYAHKVCQAIQSGKAELGMLLCSTGVGMSMAANKHKGIRAALCTDTYSARFTRMHNDANVLCMGAHVVGKGLAMDIADAFLGAAFEGGRHATRVEMLNEFEKTEFHQ